MQIFLNLLMEKYIMNKMKGIKDIVYNRVDQFRKINLLTLPTFIDEYYYVRLCEDIE